MSGLRARTGAGAARKGCNGAPERSWARGCHICPDPDRGTGWVALRGSGSIRRLRGSQPSGPTQRQREALAAYVLAGGSVHIAAAPLGTRPSTAKRHLATFAHGRAWPPSSWSTAGGRLGGFKCRA